VYYLDHATPSVRFHIEEPRFCSESWWVVPGDVPILNTIKGVDAGWGPGTPYGMNKIDWNVRPPCPTPAPSGS
jgi:hypothetical protein